MKDYFKYNFKWLFRFLKLILKFCKKSNLKKKKSPNITTNKIMNLLGVGFYKAVSTLRFGCHRKSWGLYHDCW